jgi:hypothetical protein
MSTLVGKIDAAQEAPGGTMLDAFNKDAERELRTYIPPFEGAWRYPFHTTRTNFLPSRSTVGSGETIGSSGSSISRGPSAP